MASEHEQLKTFLPALNLPGLSAHDAIVVEYTWLVMGIIILVSIFIAVRMKRIPGTLQNSFELIITLLEDLMLSIVGKKGMVYFPLIITAFLFVLISSFLGLVPGCIPPTAYFSTTAAWAIVIFLFYQYVGITKGGLRYLKHFMGPIPFMAPVMIPIEIISELARPFSLSVRLFANIMAGELIIGLLVGASAIGLPIIWMFWESVITVPIQAFIFSLLTMIYLSGAVAASDHDHH